MSDALRIPIVADDAQFKQVMQRVQTTAAATGGAIGKVGAVVQGTGTLFAEAGTKIGGMAGNVGQLVSAFVVGGPLYLGIAAVTAGVSYLAGEWVKAREEAQKATDAWEKETGAIRDRLTKAQHQLDITRKYGTQANPELMGEVERLNRKYNAALVAAEMEKPKTAAELVGDGMTTRAAYRAEESQRKIYEGKKLAADQALVDLKVTIKTLEAEEARAKILKDIADTKGGKHGPRMVLGTAVEGAVPDWALYPARPSGGRAPIEYDESVGSELDRLQQLGQMVRQQEQERQELIQEHQDIAAMRRDEDREAEAEAHRERMTQLEDYYNKRQEYGAKIAATAQQETAGLASYVGGQVDNVVGLYGALAGARAEGNREAVRAVEEQEKWLAERIAAETLKYIGTRAVAEGTILVGKGIGEASLGNPGAAGAIAAGAGLIVAGGAMGAAGAFLGGYISGASGGASGAYGESSGYVAGRLATGSTEGGNGQVVVHHHYYGPVFGDEDGASRAVYKLHKRGARLEHAA